MMTPIVKQVEEKAYLVGVSLPNSSVAKEREYLEELEQLAVTAGATVVGRTVQARTRIDGSTYIGTGKVQELKRECLRLGANLLIFDSDLSPAQARNLERVLNINVIDRSELILDIFARHAKTRQAKIQVELAQLNYMLPRLRKLWDHLSRQAGGIGTRGPGETQLEVDRRRIDARMSRLKKQLKKIQKRKDTIRRSRRDLPVVAIVGYTNAGKSTLMNALTGACTAVRDRLFATLDTMARRLKLSPGRKANGREPILMLDTVGFIRKLPHHLVESFRATLGDIAQASMYLHVVDISHQASFEQIEVVNSTLSTIEKGSVETVMVFNKIDLVDDNLIESLKRRYPVAAFISAARRIGLEDVRRKVEGFFYGNVLQVQVKLPTEEGRQIALIKSMLNEAREEFSDGDCYLYGRIDSRYAERLEEIEGVEVKYVM